VLPEDLDEPCQTSVVDNSLALSGGVEVLNVDHALEPRVLACYRTHGVGQVLTEPGRLAGDRRPAGLLRDVEANEAVVCIDELPSVVLAAKVA